MRKFLSIVGICFLGCLAWAEPGKQVRYEQHLDASKLLKMELHAGDYRIVAGKSDLMVVTYETRRTEDLKRVHIEFNGKSESNFFRIDAPGKSHLTVSIEIPQHSDLYVRLTAGDLRLGSIEGNKDIELHAGDLDINVPLPEAYSAVDLSVKIGDVNWGPYVNKSGFFRSAKVQGGGKYRLHAHVGVGDLTLHNGEKI